MPSMQETKSRVKSELADVDHNAILASLQEEIDRHNQAREDNGSSGRHENYDGKSRRLRFKERRPPSPDLASQTRRRRKREHREQRRREKQLREPAQRHEHEKGKRARDAPRLSAEEEEQETVHPFPREPANPDSQHSDPNAAFRESLFDALADDEAADYWQHVYSQPIHVYSRPNVETPSGKLEQMNDDEYVAYVQTKMWEKKNPHIVQERTRKERERKEAEAAQTREREAFVRRKEQAAWERAQRRNARRNAKADSEGEESDRNYEYVFDFDDRKHSRSARQPISDTAKEFAGAWSKYLGAWEDLTHELLEPEKHTKSGQKVEPSKRIPWPVLAGKPVVKKNIEDFMGHLPWREGQTKLQLLKTERVRWHPDKVQQRFRQEVDEGTMKLVTGVFQVVDALHEAERARTK